MLLICFFFDYRIGKTGEDARDALTQKWSPLLVNPNNGGAKTPVAPTVSMHAWLLLQQQQHAINEAVSPTPNCVYRNSSPPELVLNVLRWIFPTSSFEEVQQCMPKPDKPKHMESLVALQQQPDEKRSWTALSLSETEIEKDKALDSAKVTLLQHSEKLATVQLEMAEMRDLLIQDTRKSEGWKEEAVPSVGHNFDDL